MGGGVVVAVVVVADIVVVIIVVIIVVAIVIVVAGKPNNVGFVDDQVRTPRLTTRTMQSPDKRGVDIRVLIREG